MDRSNRQGEQIATNQELPETAQQIRDWGINVMVGMLMIYLVHEFAETLVGPLPAKLAAAITTIALVYVVLVKRELVKRMKEELVTE